MARFFAGLNKDIQNIVDYKEYRTIHRLFHLACKAEREVQDRQPWRRTNNSAGRPTWTPRSDTSTSVDRAAPSFSKASTPTSAPSPSAQPSANGGSRSAASSVASTGRSRDI